MASIFTRIINGELPSHTVAESDDYIAILDIRPLAEGHTLCIPKREVDYYFDLKEEELKGLTAFSQRVARALEKTVECKRVAVLVLGLEVPHAHVHLIPLRSEKEFWGGEAVKVTDGRMAEIAEGIRQNFG